MTKKYYVNKQAQSNGDHEVRLKLYEHTTCYTAVTMAKSYYHRVNGCKYCCKECHTQ